MAAFRSTSYSLRKSASISSSAKLTPYTAPWPQNISPFRLSNPLTQELSVYDINERDRGSPAYLRLSQKSINSLGDFVPFSNKVANLVTLQGENQPFIRNVMTLKSCSPTVGVDVMSFDTEKELLLAWRDLIHEVDPDIIIGYNICKFDLPYLIQDAYLPQRLL